MGGAPTLRRWFLPASPPPVPRLSSSGPTSSRLCWGGHGAAENRQDESRARSEVSHSSGVLAVQHRGAFLSLSPTRSSARSPPDQTDRTAPSRGWRQHKTKASVAVYSSPPPRRGAGADLPDQ